MQIAVVTGASSGMGTEFVRKLDKAHELDEIWVIARREDRLAKLAADPSIKAKIRPIPLDLTDVKAIEEYESLLKSEEPQVQILVNAAGFGKFKKSDEVPLCDQYGMIELNVRALTGMTHVTLPFMPSGGEIYQFGSASSFQPVPYINVYAASKAYVLSYSRALSVELKSRGIRVMAVCPFWTKTEFFDRAVSDDTITYYTRYYTPQQVVDRAIKDMAKGRDVSICGFATRMQVRMVKLLPHKLVMKIWCRQQKK